MKMKARGKKKDIKDCKTSYSKCCCHDLVILFLLNIPVLIKYYNLLTVNIRAYVGGCFVVLILYLFGLSVLFFCYTLQKYWVFFRGTMCKPFNSFHAFIKSISTGMAKLFALFGIGRSV